MKRTLSTLTALATLALATTASAQDVPFSVHLDPSLALPLGDNMTHLFNPGVGFNASAEWELHPNVAIGPGLYSLYLPRSQDTSNAGVLWQLAIPVRFQGERRATSFVGSHVIPWAEVAPALALTGDIPRPAINLAIGIDSPLDKNRIFFLGPQIRYTHVFAWDDAHHDADVLQAGLSFSFDLPVHLPTVVKHHVHREVVFVSPPVKVAQATPCPTPKVEFTEHVYFDVDSSKLRWESRDKLDAVVAKLKALPDEKIKVSGNASSDGQLAHNIKLSDARTKAVVDYLVAHGVPSTRLVPQSLGVSHPSAPNTSKEGRERNRRVEFAVSFTSSSK